MSMFNLDPSAWDWKVCEANVPYHSPHFPRVIFEGQCGSYTACLMAFKLLGIKPRLKGKVIRIYYGDVQVYIEFKRVPDGLQMEEWGSTAFEQLPPG
jgi:hypothetical protein